MITMEMEGWEIDSIASFGMAIAFFLPVLLPNLHFRFSRIRLSGTRIQATM